jgi:hypothetical protein
MGPPAEVPSWQAWQAGKPARAERVEKASHNGSGDPGVRVPAIPVGFPQEGGWDVF